MRSPTASGERSAFTLTCWTADPAVAAAADAAGVDRVGVDLERIGKAERQAGLGTWISPHTEHDLLRVAARLRGSRLFARVNPVHGDTRAEVDAVLACGAQVLMLPMFRSAEEVGTFVEAVAGRAESVLLLECAEAVERVEEILSVPGVREVHLGLNDLSLSLGCANRFAVLVTEEVEHVATAVHGAGRRLGVGGLGRACQPGLPVPADLLYAEQARLGSSGALLARAFLPRGASRSGLRHEVGRARRRIADWRTADDAALARAHSGLRRATTHAGVW
jgi:2-keto-3-deoxy-L-rhamnonate aldolase RhmA